MSYLRLIITAALSAFLAVACTQEDQEGQRFSDTAPQVDADVRTSDGQSVGTVERVRFESSAQAVIDAYVIEYGGTAEIGGREVLIPADRASWSGRNTNPLLEIDYTFEELEALPDFDESRATDYALADNPTEDAAPEDAAPAAPGVSEPLMGEPADTAMRDDEAEGIVWDTSPFDPYSFDRSEWVDREVFTTGGDELGIIVDVQPAEGTPQVLIVRTHPDFMNVGETVELDVAQVIGVAEDARAVRASYVIVETDPDPIIEN